MLDDCTNEFEGELVCGRESDFASLRHRSTVGGCVVHTNLGCELHFLENYFTTVFLLNVLAVLATTKDVQFKSPSITIESSL